MALIDCPECSKKISDKAPSCPHCGVVFEDNEDVEKISRHPEKVDVVAGKATPNFESHNYFLEPDMLEEDPDIPPAINEKNEDNFFFNRLFIIAHWTSVIIGIGLVLLLTLALGASRTPKPATYTESVGIMIVGACLLPFLVAGIYRIGLYLFYLKKLSISFRKYWINSFGPTLVAISIAALGYGILEYNKKTKGNPRPPSVFDTIENVNGNKGVQNDSDNPPPYTTENLFSTTVKVYDPINNKFIDKKGYPSIDGVLLKSNNELIGIVNNINRYDGSINITHIYDYNDHHFAKTLSYEQIDIRRSMFNKEDLKMYEGNIVTFKCHKTGDSIEVREGGDWKFVVKSRRLSYHPNLIRAIKNKKLVELFSYISFGAERIKALSDPEWKSYHDKRLSK